MAKKKFVFQGFTSATHVDAVRDLLALGSIENALISVAFANARGVELLRKALSPIGPNATVFVGIRNDITTKQGLAALLDLKVKLYAIDTGGRSPLFHPKLFLARSKSAAKVVIGSANLTPGGLNNNIEASLALELDLSSKADEALLSSIEDEFKQLPTSYPDHVFRVRKLKEVVKLADDGRLIDEAISNPPNPVASAKGDKADKVPKIKLKTKPVHLVLPSPKKIKAVTTKATAQASTATSAAPSWMLVHDLDTAAAYVERSLVLNPNHAPNWIYSGWVHLFLGQYDVAVEHLSRAGRLSPFDGQSSRLGVAMTAVHYFAGRYDMACSWINKVLADVEAPNPLRYAVASAAMAGRAEEAARLRQRLERVDPTFRISLLRDVIGPHKDPETFARYAEGLRRAGLPE